MKHNQHNHSQNQERKSQSTAHGFASSKNRLDKTEFWQSTSKINSKFSTSVPFSTYVRRLGNAITDKERRARIICALAIGDNRAKHEGKKIKSCRAGVRSINGELIPFIRSCESRWCPYCARRNAKKLQQELLKAFTGVASCSSGNWSWLTLTLNQRNLKTGSAQEAFDAIRHNLSRLFNRPEWKDVVDGVYYKIEVTKPNGYYHFHAHLVIYHETSRRQLDRVIKNLWVTAFAKKGTGWIYKLKKFNIKSHKSLLEITKYTAKCLDMTVSDLASIASATTGRKLSGATGFIKDALACVRKTKEKLGDVPAPPTNFNPKSGELYSLPAGEYSLQDLLAEVVNYQTESAVYALKLLQYRFRYGYRHEEAKNASKTG